MLGLNSANLGDVESILSFSTIKRLYRTNRQSVKKERLLPGKALFVIGRGCIMRGRKNEEEHTMRRETTPSGVTDKIMELCGGILADAESVYIPVVAQKWSLPSECFPNVECMVREQGGQQVNGRVVWQWMNIIVEVEIRSVWRSPEGELIDITPRANGEREILFLHDAGMVYSGQSIGNVKLAINGLPLAAELVDFGDRIDAVMCSYKPGTEIPLSELRYRLLPLKERGRQSWGG